MEIKFNQNAIKQKIRDAARAKAATIQKMISCPHCGWQVMVSAGDNICPACKKHIAVELDISGINNINI